MAERFSDCTYIEPHIPHNWGIGLGEALDSLDAATRRLINSAIAAEDDEVEDTLYGDAVYLATKKELNMFGRWQNGRRRRG